LNPVVTLRSGGYIVINPTEALVAIDVNSGRSTREYNIEETALKTNIEAAEEVARQLRLRDLAGLVVVDFIDMDVNGNNRKVERALKDALKQDRARIQVGRISSFGLLEMSRQRLRTGVLEASTQVCPMCDGSGLVRTDGSAALQALRMLEEEAVKGRASHFRLRADSSVAVYMLNRKRAELAELEARYGVIIEVVPDESLIGGRVAIDSSGPPPAEAPRMLALASPATIEIEEDEIEDIEDEEEADEEASGDRDDRDDRGGRDRDRGDRGGRGRGRRRRRGGRDRDREPGEAREVADSTDEGASDEAQPEQFAEGGDAEADGREPRRKRRRRRRGGRRENGEALGAEGAEGEADAAGADAVAEEAPAAEAEAAPKPRRGRRKAAEAVEAVTEVAAEAPAEAEAAPAVEEAPKGRKRPAKAKADTGKEGTGKASKTKAEKAPAEAAPAEAAEAEVPAEPAAEKPKRARKAAPAKEAAPKAEAKPEAAKPAGRAKAAKAPAAPAPEAGAETADAADAPADGEGEPDGPPRRGWWQRTFGN
jgi:ribonuclease E